MIRRIVLYIIVFLPMMVAAGDLQFCEEELTFLLNDSVFTVNGNYYFCNTGHQMVKTLIFYPFPDYNITQLDSVLVMNVNDNTILPVRHISSEGCTFPIAVDPDSRLHVFIRYRQIINTDSVEYIVSTTAGWNKPLNRAQFSLVTDASSARVKGFMYEPQDSLIQENYKTYFWDFHGFMPQKEMRFYLK